MLYLASSVFFGIWAYLFHFFNPADFTLYLDPAVSFSGVMRPSAVWMLLPLAFGVYLFVVADVERRRAGQAQRDTMQG